MTTLTKIFHKELRTYIRLSFFKYVLVTYLLFQPEVVGSQSIYPDGGRNVFPIVTNKRRGVQPYNDGTVMAHVIGSAGMNFQYYFHVLSVACENTDPEFYKVIQTDYEFCLNKTGPLPPQLGNQPLGSIPKPCVDWKIHIRCYKNLADDYDECLAKRPGLVKKGTDALRFTHAYAKFICGNIADTEAHLLDRYHKHDLVVDGVFQCFPHLQDRIVNCVKRDKVSKTLCGKFYIVHACFGKYYNDDNCQDEQPIYYMDDLFRNMSTSLNCPKDDNEWTNRDPPSTTEGYPSTYPTEPPKKGWGREDPSSRENPWPGERGRPWPTDRDRGETFIRDRPQLRHHDHRGWGWGENSRESGQGQTRIGGTGRTNTYIHSHSHRPYPDKNWDNKPWIDVLDRGTAGRGSPWEPVRGQNEVDTGRQGGLSYQYGSREPSSTDRGRHQYFTSSQRGSGGRFAAVTLPPAGFAVTRSSHNTAGDYSGSKASPTSSENSQYNFYSFK